MKPILTTITPYWDRPEMLTVWLKAIEGATIPGVVHCLCAVGNQSIGPIRFSNLKILHLIKHLPGELSIAHYHTLGVKVTTTPWVMKLDVDTIPHETYFSDLLNVLESAKPKEWFNGGMLYVNPETTSMYLQASQMPLSVAAYEAIMDRRAMATGEGFYRYPQATNWICRREDYPATHPEFRGWGWEDYYQIYELERNQLGCDPLPGPVTLPNVTQRCREEISRRKAMELWKTDSRLCLIHRYHPKNTTSLYRGHKDQNKALLFNHIKKIKELNG